MQFVYTLQLQENEICILHLDHFHENMAPKARVANIFLKCVSMSLPGKPFLVFLKLLPSPRDFLYWALSISCPFQSHPI